MKILAEMYMLPRSIVHFDPGKNVKNRDLVIFEIPSIDEVDGIYLATSRGLLWGKIEPQDYILMFCSAKAPGITYRFSVVNFVRHFGRNKYVRFPPSKFMLIEDAIRRAPATPQESFTFLVRKLHVLVRGVCYNLVLPEHLQTFW